MTDYDPLVRGWRRYAKGYEMIGDYQTCARYRDAADAVESLTAELSDTEEELDGWKTVSDYRERRERTVLLAMGVDVLSVQSADLVDTATRLKSERDEALAKVARVEALADKWEKATVGDIGQDWRTIQIRRSLEVRRETEEDTN